MSSLTVSIDTIEPRTAADRLVVLGDSNNWDLFNSSDAIGVETVAFTTMLKPVQFTTEWGTTFTGRYKRYRKADYLLATPTNWKEHQRGTAGNYYLVGGSVAEKVYTPALERNQGIFLSWVAYNVGNDLFIQLECGWDETGAGGGNVKLRFWSDGSVEVWKDNVYIANGKIGAGELYYPTEFGPQGVKQEHATRQTAQDTVDVILLPYRFRELLVMSTTQGGGFNQLFDDLDPDSDTVPTITGSGRFWWYVPSGQATVQAALVRTAADAGTVYTMPFRLRYPPFGGQDQGLDAFWDEPGYGAVSATATLTDFNGDPFVSDGTADVCRIKVVLTGDGTASPWLYGAGAAFPSISLNTSGPSTNLSSFLRAASPPSLRVADQPSDNRLTISLKQPETLNDNGMFGAVTIGNRPLEASIGGITIFSGRTGSPQWVESTSGFGAVNQDIARELMIEVRDRWKALEKFIIADPEPLDGMNLADAIAYFVMLPGYSVADLEIDDIDFFLPRTPAASKGEYALIPEVGDTAAEWVKRLWDDYAQTFIYGWTPRASGPKFMFRHPNSLGTTPLGTLYANVATAGATEVYRSYKETTLEPEANDIWVTGLDPRTKRVIQAHYADLDSQDPTLAPFARPANWLGEKRKYALEDPAITEQGVANWAAAILADRLTPVRVMGEWESQMLFAGDGSPAWRGDCIGLSGLGVYRINTISGDFPHENMSTPFRQFTYCAELVA